MRSSLQRYRHLLSGTISRLRALSTQSAEPSSLVLVEHKAADGSLAPSTLATVGAAVVLGGSVTALVQGHGACVSAAAAAAAKVAGVHRVVVADHASLDHQLAEPCAALVAALHSRLAFSHILAPASTWGKDLLPRAAALLGCQPLSDIIATLDADTFIRPIYAGNALATVKYTQPGLRMVTVRATAFPPAAIDEQRVPAPQEAAKAEELQAAAAAGGSKRWVSEDVRRSERPDLGSARVVVCGGRALKSAENFSTLERLADLLGGAVGASRAAVDAGFCANDLQVGQTGKVVAPELYLALGISGAIQHVAGMKDSKCIVAINTDAEAPIFQLADYGLVADLFTALPELEVELAKLKAKG